MIILYSYTPKSPTCSVYHIQPDHARLASSFCSLSCGLSHIFCSEAALLIYTVCYKSQWELWHRSNITSRLQKQSWALMFWPDLFICYIQYQGGNALVQWYTVFFNSYDYILWCTHNLCRLNKISTTFYTVSLWYCISLKKTCLIATKLWCIADIVLILYNYTEFHIFKM